MPISIPSYPRWEGCRCPYALPRRQGPLPQVQGTFGERKNRSKVSLTPATVLPIRDISWGIRPPELEASQVSLTQDDFLFGDIFLAGRPGVPYPGRFPIWGFFWADLPRCPCPGVPYPGRFPRYGFFWLVL
jgi:hypothetical protein